MFYYKRCHKTSLMIAHLSDYCYMSVFDDYHIIHIIEEMEMSWVLVYSKSEILKMHNCSAQAVRGYLG